MPDSKPFAGITAPASGTEPEHNTRALSPVSHDVVLQVRVSDQLKGSPELAAADINVVVRNRSATLFGSVANEAQRGLSQRLATAVSGIIEVSNRLKITC